MSLVQLLLLAVAAVGAPHPGPPVFLQAAVADGRVSVTFSAEQVVALPWLGETAPAVPPLADDLRGRLEQAALELLSNELRVTIDGAPAPLAAIDSVQVFNEFGPGNTEPSITIDAHFLCAGTPRSVGFVWQFYDDVEDGKRKLPLVIDAAGEFEFKTLTEEEPEYTWRSRVVPGGRGNPEPAEVPVSGSGSRSAPVGVLLGGVVAGTLLLRRGAGRVAGAIMALALVVAAWTWPRGPGPLELPGNEQARAIFETLHRNLYSAFDARSEDEIYDRLALSVDAGLLDELYGDIYESLILRDDGGALCRVESVEMQSGAVLPSTSDAVQFEVDWTWRVTGQVVHYGHEHRRTNQYHARYTVAAVRATWRIVDVEIFSHERVDPEREG